MHMHTGKLDTAELESRNLIGPYTVSSILLLDNQVIGGHAH